LYIFQVTPPPPAPLPPSEVGNFFFDDLGEKMKKLNIKFEKILVDLILSIIFFENPEFLIINYKL